MAKVRIPTPLRSFTQGRDEVAITGQTIGDVLKNLEKEFQGIGDKILDEKGNIRRFINVFVGENDVRHLKGLQTEVKSDEVVSIFPAIAGGC